MKGSYTSTHTHETDRRHRNTGRSSLMCVRLGVFQSALRILAFRNKSDLLLFSLDYFSPSTYSSLPLFQCRVCIIYSKARIHSSSLLESSSSFLVAFFSTTGALVVHYMIVKTFTSFLLSYFSNATYKLKLSRHEKRRHEVERMKRE